MLRIIFLFLFLSVLNLSFSQDKIKVHGKVLDDLDQRPVVGASIIHPNSNLTYMTDGTGEFTLYCNQTDDIFIFLPSYKTYRFNLKDSIFKSVYEITFMFERLVGTTSRPVIIKPKKDFDDIAEERKKLGQIPKELQKPTFSYTNPIGSLYDLLSKRARERDKMRELYIEDQRRKIFRELFDYYNESKLFDLPPEYYESFIDYLGLPIDFIRENSDYEITHVILAQYRKFGLQKGFVK